MRYWYSVEGEVYRFNDWPSARFHHFVSINRMFDIGEWKRIRQRISKTANELTERPKKGEENLRVQTLRYRILKYTVNDAVVDWLRRNVQCGQCEAQWGTYPSNGTQIDIGFRRKQDALKFLMWWADGIQPMHDTEILDITPKDKWLDEK